MLTTHFILACWAVLDFTASEEKAKERQRHQPAIRGPKLGWERDRERGGSTVCFQPVCQLVDLALQSGVSGELVHHADGGLLLLHLLDLRPHLSLLLSVLLDHSG